MSIQYKPFQKLRMDYSPTYSEASRTPTKNQKKILQEKKQTNIPLEYRCKNSKQNFSKSKATIY